MISLRSRGRGMCTRLFRVRSRSFRVNYTPACLKITNEISSLGVLPGPTCRGGGGPKVENLCACFHKLRAPHRGTSLGPLVCGANNSRERRESKGEWKGHKGALGKRVELTLVV
jgi:hypothetical protein